LKAAIEGDRRLPDCRQLLSICAIERPFYGAQNPRNGKQLALISPFWSDDFSGVDTIRFLGLWLMRAPWLAVHLKFWTLGRSL